PPERAATLAEPQRHYVKAGPGGRLYHLDVHWKIANPQLFADALTFDDLHARAIAVPRLGPAARTLSAPAAVVLACIHRVAHHADAIDLVWVWDIHLLVKDMTAREREQIVMTARRAAVCAVCARGIQLAADYCSTPGASTLAAELASAAAAS